MLRMLTSAAKESGRERNTEQGAPTRLFVGWLQYDKRLNVAQRVVPLKLKNQTLLFEVRRTDSRRRRHRRPPPRLHMDPSNVYLMQPEAPLSSAACPDPSCLCEKPLGLDLACHLRT